MPHSRRDFVKGGLGLGVGAALGSAASARPPADEGAPPAGEAAPGSELSLTEFEPRSMLVTDVTPVDRAKYAVIDMHTHVSSVMRREATGGHPLQGTGPERLDQHARFFRDVQAAGHEVSGQRLGLRVLLPQRHEHGHAALGPLDAAASGRGEGEVGDFVTDPGAHAAS